MTRIKKAFKENGSPDPIFDFNEGRTYYEVDFFIHPAINGKKKANATNKHINICTSIDTLKENTKRVLSILKYNPNITASEIALELNISVRAAQKQIANLKPLGIIERIGSYKTGYWMIKESE